MKKYKLPILIFISFFGYSAFFEETISAPIENTYFPPLSGDIWETKSIDELNWNRDAVKPLLDFLEQKNTKGFIILINGKIVLENYFKGHTVSSNWYWASAGKTLTSTITGIAEQEKYLNCTDKVSKYIGTGWTSEPQTKENSITIKNLLTMTSGIEDIKNGDCITPNCLTYKSDAGNRWAYHNVYVKLQDVIEKATKQSFNSYFNAKLKNKIGMNGSWIQFRNNRVYWSTTRSMARFGLLMQNNGKWNNSTIINEDFINEATTTSQNSNQSYGYLWWLNGKTSYRLPRTQIQFNRSLVPTGPNDMFMALGKNDQKLYVVPSKKMVVVRMGEAADSKNLALSNFDEELWTKISALYQ